MNLCKDCKHFIPGRMGDETERCSAFDDQITSYIDPVDGSTRYDLKQGRGGQSRRLSCRPQCCYTNTSGKCGDFEKVQAPLKRAPVGLWAWMCGYR